MNHANGGVRVSGANAPVVPDRLLALTTEALAFVSRDRAEGMARRWLAGVPLSNSNEQSVLARSLALELALSVPSVKGTTAFDRLARAMKDRSPENAAAVTLLRRSRLRLAVRDGSRQRARSQIGHHLAESLIDVDVTRASRDHEVCERRLHEQATHRLRGRRERQTTRRTPPPLRLRRRDRASRRRPLPGSILEQAACLRAGGRCRARCRQPAGRCARVRRPCTVRWTEGSAATLLVLRPSPVTAAGTR